MRVPAHRFALADAAPVAMRRADNRAGAASDVCYETARGEAVAMKNSALQERRGERGRHALAILEYALLLLIGGALALGLWTRVGHKLLNSLREDAPETQPAPH